LTKRKNEHLNSLEVFGKYIHWNKCTIATFRLLGVVGRVLVTRTGFGGQVDGWRQQGGRTCSKFGWSGRIFL
jgi:hypothetical protein